MTVQRLPRAVPGATSGTNSAGTALPARSVARRRLCIGLTGIALSGFLAGRRVLAQEAEPAVAQLREFYATLLQTMKQGGSLQGRYEKLAPAVRKLFDLPAMARIAVGPSWPNIPEPQQAQIMDQFSRMTIGNYASNFSAYTGETFEVDPQPVERGSNRVVKSRLTPQGKEPVVLNYLFHATPEGWKAIDVYLTGTISELATRRSDFSTILKTGGPGALIESLKARNDKLMHS